MTTINTLLIQYNEIRAHNNQKPLRAWKESKAKLQARITKEAPTTETFTIVEYCENHDLNPKSARNKLRKQNIPTVANGWMFSADQRPQLDALFIS